MNEWLKSYSKDISAKDASTNGCRETKKKNQESAQNVKAHIGINLEKNNHRQKSSQLFLN